MNVTITVTNTGLNGIRIVVRKMPGFVDSEAVIAPGAVGEFQSDAGRQTMLMVGTSGTPNEADVEISNKAGIAISLDAPKQFDPKVSSLGSGETLMTKFVSTRTKTEYAQAGVIMITEAP